LSVLKYDELKILIILFISTQLKLYNIVTVPTAIYGSETRIQTVGKKFLCEVTRYMHTDHRHTGKILKIFSHNITVQNYRNIWLQN